MARPLFTTEIASAVLNVPLGAFNFVFPSLVAPCRSSRKMVTTRRISSSAGFSAGSCITFSKLSTRRRTMSISSSIVSGKGRMTVLKRRFKALDKSLTPLSRLFAVPMILKPRIACTSLFNSGIGSVFSERIVIRVSCTSEPIRVNSSIRPILPSCMAFIIGVCTSAPSLGPSASSRA